MKKIDVSPYNTLGEDGDEYDVKEAIVAVAFNTEQRLSATELLKRDDLARKVLASDNTLLLEEAEYSMLKKSFDMIAGFQRNDVEFVRRILNAETVEVAEVQK